MKLNLEKEGVTICCHCSHKEVVEKQMNLLKPIGQLINVHWNNRCDRHPEYYDSYCEMLNECLITSPTETVVLINDRVTPRPLEIMQMFRLLNMGYSAVAKYNIGYLMVTKELFREIGWWDERFYGGGYEDDDFCLRLRLANLAYFESQEGIYEYSWKTSVRPPGGDACSKSKPHFESKWKQTNEEIRRVVPEESFEKYRGKLGERRNDIKENWMTWDNSILGVEYANPDKIARGAGESRAKWFMDSPWFPFREYRKVTTD